MARNGSVSRMASDTFSRRVWKTKASASSHLPTSPLANCRKNRLYCFIEPETSSSSTKRTGRTGRRRRTRSIGSPPFDSPRRMMRRMSSRSPFDAAMRRRDRLKRIAAASFIASASASASSAGSTIWRRSVLASAASRPAISLPVAASDSASSSPAALELGGPAAAESSGGRTLSQIFGRAALSGLPERSFCRRTRSLPRANQNASNRSSNRSQSSCRPHSAVFSRSRESAGSRSGSRARISSAPSVSRGPRGKPFRRRWPMKPAMRADKT